MGSIGAMLKGLGDKRNTITPQGRDLTSEISLLFSEPLPSYTEAHDAVKKAAKAKSNASRTTAKRSATDRDDQEQLTTAKKPKSNRAGKSGSGREQRKQTGTAEAVVGETEAAMEPEPALSSAETAQFLAAIGALGQRDQQRQLHQDVTQDQDIFSDILNVPQLPELPGELPGEQNQYDDWMGNTFR